MCSEVVPLREQHATHTDREETRETRLLRLSGLVGIRPQVAPQAGAKRNPDMGHIRLQIRRKGTWSTT